MHQYSFEKLDIWKLSIKLASQIYLLTETLPNDEKYGLSSQLKRASTSISTNIAEGVCRFTNKEKSRFIEIAYGSAIEVMSHLLLTHELNLINDNQLGEFRLKVNELTNKLNAFYQKLKKNDNQ